MIYEEKVYASTGDVISAIELLWELDKKENMYGGFLDISKAICLNNMGCIKDTEEVLIITPEVDIISWVTEYINLPHRLLVKKIGSLEDNDKWTESFKKSCEILKEILYEYGYTKPTILGLEDEIKEESQDVIITAISVFTKGSIELWDRFCLEAGEEYDEYEKMLGDMSRALKNGGRLILLCKASWVLKSWQLLEELKLQLEYQQYRLYMDDIARPNRLVWLRFIKLTEDFNLDSQKRNISSLMEDNYIDRLFAHRNNLIFPYVKLSYENTELSVELTQNLQHMQYFFSLKTTKELAELCQGYAACLTTPSVAQYAYEEGRNIVLFEMDNRFREKKGMKFVKYDLNTGLTKFTERKYANKFDMVICDPPFNIKLDVLARDIAQLLKTNTKAFAYVVFPQERKQSLINAMKYEGLLLVEDDIDIEIEYGRPPKLVRVQGKDAIQLYKFLRYR